MRLDALVLLWREAVFLQEDFVRNADFADIVQTRGQGEDVHLVVIQAHGGPDGLGEGDHAPGVIPGVVISDAQSVIEHMLQFEANMKQGSTPLSQCQLVVIWHLATYSRADLLQRLSI